MHEIIGELEKHPITIEKFNYRGMQEMLLL